PPAFCVAPRAACAAVRSARPKEGESNEPSAPPFRPPCLMSDPLAPPMTPPAAPPMPPPAAPPMAPMRPKPSPHASGTPENLRLRIAGKQGGNGCAGNKMRDSHDPSLL